MLSVAPLGLECEHFLNGSNKCPWNLEDDANPCRVGFGGGPCPRWTSETRLGWPGTSSRANIRG